MTPILVQTPWTGEPLGEFPATDPNLSPAMLQRARTAQGLWWQKSITERVAGLAPLTPALLGDVDAWCEVIMQATGKTRCEALLGEIYPSVALARYYERHAATILRDEDVAVSPWTFPGTTARIARRPFGVVLVIAPWNYPLQLMLAPLLTALYAGNAVIIKPAEQSLPIAARLADLLAGLALPDDLVQWAYGDATLAEALIDARPDLVFFTGGLAGGRAVGKRAARHPIPVILELGGKDPMIVFADADLERAANAALYGAFCHSGQVCVSVERLYVERAAYEPFIARLCDGVARLRSDPDGELGAMTTARQIATVTAHYDDALAQGAKASAPLHLDGQCLRPVVLWDVHHGMRVMREETFGPLLPVMAFDDTAQVIDLANDSDFGLNASVWSLDLAKAERVARQLETGNWMINDVIKNVGHPALPFGGVKHSGFGRYHGAEGLLSMTYAVSGMTHRGHLPREPNWFPYSYEHYQHCKGYLDFVYGAGPLWQRLRRNQKALQAFRDYAAFDGAQRWHNFKLWLKGNRTR